MAHLTRYTNALADGGEIGGIKMDYYNKLIDDLSFYGAIYGGGAVCRGATFPAVDRGEAGTVGKSGKRNSKSGKSFAGDGR